MNAGEGAGDALFRGPLPTGFTRRILRLETGCEVDPELCRLPDAIVVVDEGELEIECRAGGRRRFGCGSMIPIARVPVARARSVGPDPLALTFVSRAPVRPADEFPEGSGSYSDC